MARLVVDENLRGNVLELFRDAGHDVLSIYETARSMTDREILRLSVRESRILVTLDKTDFGALIYQERLPPPPAVILFRLYGFNAADASYFMLGSIAARDDWEGYFWVIGARGGRRRSLPSL